MIKIKQIHLWMRDKKGKWNEPDIPNKSGNPHPGKLVILEPGNAVSPVQLKLQIAAELQKWIPKGLERYYVVMVVERPGGDLSYRVVIPMTPVQ